MIDDCHQVRIAEGEHPQDIRESDYFTERGEFRVDSEGSPTLLNCLMYKLSYYRYYRMVVHEKYYITQTLCQVWRTEDGLQKPGWL